MANPPLVRLNLSAANLPRVVNPPAANPPAVVPAAVNPQVVHFVVSNNALDIKGLRLPGTDKPFEQLTISELVQLRPGGAAEDAGNYNVEAVGSDATVSTSSALSQLAQTAGNAAVQQELSAAQVRNIFTGGNILPNIGG